MPVIKLDYDPQPKQQLLHNIKARQILFGGAAGGGKSHALRWDAIMFCLQNPGMEAFLFRRTLTELDDNHCRVIETEIPKSLGTYSNAYRYMQFSNGSFLRFCYCERESDIMKYQGAEIHWLGVDEATHLSPGQLAFLRTRNRLGRYQSHKGFKDKDFLPRVVYATNPGGPSHNFLKSIFIDDHEPLKIFNDPTTIDPDNPQDKGWESVFIPSRMSDNKHLDKGYGGSFSGLSPERAKALREGDWDVVSGAALESLEKRRHMIKPITPPAHWTRWMSMDWGVAVPFSIGWYCMNDDDVTIVDNPHLDFSPENPRRSILVPAGSIIRYAEWYGSTGKPNQGLRLDSTAVARKIVEMEKARQERPMDYRIADSAMWSQTDGPAPAERMFEATSGLIKLRPSVKDRRANYNEILARLAGNPLLFDDGTIREHPAFFVTSDCTQFWRTVPVLIIDAHDPDKGPDTNQEDHVYDDVSYSLRSRPFLMTPEDRFEEEFGAEYRRMRKTGGDPYGT